MIRAKLAAFCLIMAALLGWQIAGVVTTTRGAGKGIPCDSNRASSAGSGCWLVCPLGDGDRLDEWGATISIVVRNCLNVPIAGIPATDFWLVGCADGLVLCGGRGIQADSATNANGETTISGAMMAGGCAPYGLAVIAQGLVVLNHDKINILCLPIITKSVDVSGDGGVIDGVVELVDFAAFGQVYNKPADYDECFDYNCDGEVELVDYSIFGQHWEHACPGGLQSP